MTGFLSFPSSETIVARLSQVEELDLQTQQLFAAIGERVGGQVYDGAAFSFLLMELIHEYEIAWGRDLGPLLPRVILALTGDRELARTALKAFDEIKTAIAQGAD